MLFYFVSSGIFYYLHIYAYAYGVCFLFIDLPSEYATRRDNTRDLHMMALYAVVLADNQQMLSFFFFEFNGLTCNK